MMKAPATFEWGDELPNLEGERIILRGMRSSDADAVYEIFRSPEVIEYWCTPAQTTVSDAVELINDADKHFKARTMFEWGAALRESDQVIGTFTLLHVDLFHKRAEVGYAIAKDFWGQGYATEGFELLLAFAFGPMNLHRLEADVHPGNKGSFRVLEKQGFQREGYLRERWQHLGRIDDGVFLGLLRPEWLKLKEQQ